MKKINLLLSVAVATLLNSADVNIKQGWQLLGNGSSQTTMNNFKKDSIKTVWSYDNRLNRWNAFSPDENISTIINNNNSIGNLYNIPQNSGFWVSANSADTVIIDDTKNIKAYNLKNGWQLLGTNIELDGFNNMSSSNQDIELIWSFDSSTQKWSAFSPKQSLKTLIEDNPNIDTLNLINSYSGFWVLTNNNDNLIIDDIKHDVQILQQTTKIANVSDAKNLFTQLREATNSLYNEDNSQDQSTIIGQQSKLITDKIEPVVESVANDLDNTVIALENSMTTFDSSIEGNFENVMNTIANRMESLESEMTVVENGNTVTITFNGATIVSVDNQGESNDTVTTTGNIVVSGTNYNLTITSLDYSDTTINFKASGTITGINNSSMTLTDMDITFDFDHAKEYTAQEIQNFEATFDGTITSANRSFRGQMILSESNKDNNKFIGTFTGASGEPSFEGTFTAKVDLDDAKEVDYGVTSIDQYDADISFDGTITAGTKQIKLTLGTKTFEDNNLEVAYAKNIEITNGNSFVKIANLNLTKKKNIDEDIFALANLQGFEISIKDSDGNYLKIDANISANNTPSLDNEIYFDGIYSYNNTTFTGKAYGNENRLKDTQSFKIEGSIVANGFEPFGIKIVGASTNGADDIYGMFIRGSDLNEYKLGFFIDENQAKLSDSNGVFGIENGDSQITIQDKDGNNLATYGESIGNTWEINYTDGSSETLF